MWGNPIGGCPKRSGRSFKVKQLTIGPKNIDITFANQFDSTRHGPWFQIIEFFQTSANFLKNFKMTNENYILRLAPKLLLSKWR